MGTPGQEGVYLQLDWYNSVYIAGRQRRYDRRRGRCCLEIAMNPQQFSRDTELYQTHKTKSIRS